MQRFEHDELPIALDSDTLEMDFSGPIPGDLEDPLPVRSLADTDLPAIIRIDRHITGHDRRDYLSQKVSEVLNQSGIRISLVAENTDGLVTGFIMARVDYGEFGRTSSTAIIDTIGVDPEFTGAHIGQALVTQLLANLTALQVHELRTEVAWNDFELNRFLAQRGFRPAQQLVLSCPL